MYMKLDEYSVRVMLKVEELTLNDVGRKGNLLELDEVALISTFEELVDIIEVLQNKIDELNEPNDFNAELEIPDPRHE